MIGSKSCVFLLIRVVKIKLLFSWDFQAGMKIRDCMRSSRFGHTATELQNKWIAAAQRELKARWDEVYFYF